MTTQGDEEQLAINVIAKLTDLERQMAKANGITAKAWREMTLTTKRATRQMELDAARSAERINAAVAMVGTRIGDLGRSAAMSAGGAIASALSVQTVIKYADAWKSAGNTLAGAGVELDKLAATQQIVADIADRSRAEIGSTAELYARLTRSSADLGATQAQIAVATETVAKGLKLSGATAGEAAGAMLQLSQALQSGKLGGDELRSLLEGAPIIARAVAKEFGVAVGELKKLGSEGKLTADRVFKAIVASADEVEAAFAKTTPTVADSFQTLENAAMRFVGTSASVKTATGLISGGLQATAKNIDVVAAGATALGALIATRLVGAGLRPLVMALGQSAPAARLGAAALETTASAMSLVALRAGAASVAAAGLRTALALAGGPAGLALLGIGAAAFYVAQKTAEAEVRAQAYAQALTAVRDGARSSADALDRHTDAVVRAAEQQAAAQTKELTGEIAKTDADIAAFAERIRNLLDTYGRMAEGNKLASAALRELAAGFDGTGASAERTRSKLDELARTNPNFAALAAKLDPLLEKLAGAAALADQLRGKLAGVPQALADAKAKALDQRVSAGVPVVSYDEAARAGMDDPVLAALKSKGALDREVARAEMDKTARAIADERKKLIDQIRESGGTVDMGAVDAAAKRIVAAREAQKGGGGGGDSEDELDRAIRRTQEHTAALLAEAAAVGKSAEEKAIAAERQKLLTAAKQADVALTPDVLKRIDAEAAAYGRAKAEVERLEKAQERARQSAEFLGESAGNALADIMIDGRNAGEVMQNLAKSIARAALQALLLGNGPLAGIFGGGLLKGLFSGGGASAGAPLKITPFARGGTFSNRIVDQPTLFGFANGTGLMGEAGPEAIMPLSRGRDGRLGVAVDGRGSRAARGGNTTQITFAPTIDARGADASAVARLERGLRDLAASIPQQVAAVQRRQQVRGLTF